MTATPSSVTRDRLLELFDYSIVSGKVYRRVSVSNNPKSAAGAKLESLSAQGYINVGVDGRTYLGHRLIWYMVTGAWPAVDIDHADRDKLNNCWLNLREANRSENTVNSGARASSKTGVKGVYKVKATGRYCVQVTMNYKKTYLGIWDTVAEAKEAYNLHCKDLHGEFYHV